MASQAHRQPRPRYTNEACAQGLYLVSMGLKARYYLFKAALGEFTNA